MEQIIISLLSTDNSVIQKATDDLKAACSRPEAITELCSITVSASQPQIRQYAAILLKKRLGKLRHWKLVDPEQQETIKQGMLNAIVQEKEKSVRSAIAQFVGILTRHEAEKKDPWMNDVLKFIYSHCSSPDPVQSELGSSIFSTLSDIVADQFVPYLEPVCEMCKTALLVTEASGNMLTPVVFNIMSAMANLVPYILGNNAAEQTYQKSVPLMIKALRAFATHPDPDMFVRAFDVLEGMADYTPRLLTLNIKMLTEFCLDTAKNNKLDTAVRVRTVAYIGWLVRLKKKVIIKHKLVEPIIQVVFNLMAAEPEVNDGDEDYFNGEDGSNPMTTATQTLDLIALNVPPEKLIPPLLTLLEPALQGNDPLPRRAAYLSMAVIAEGCSEAICNKYLGTMLDIVKVGITDSTLCVRNAAFFALGQFSEHLQPNISEFAPQILPVLLEFLQQLCNELRSGGTEPKHIDRMFYALETFCENLGDELLPHLPLLMERLFLALDTNNSVRLRELAFSTISAAVCAAKENMMPFFHQTIDLLKVYLVKTEDEDILKLRPQAIETLASIARSVGKENFMPLATDTMNFALSLLEGVDDPDVRRSVYSLISSLAEVVEEEMSTVYPKIMERIYDSILTTDEVVPEMDPFSINVPDAESENDENIDNDIDIENSVGEEDDDDNVAGYSVENAYLDEKEEAILTLKNFAEHTGRAFLPYLEQSYENVYKMIDHPQETVRKVAIDSLTAFVIAFYKYTDAKSVALIIPILVPKLGNMIHEDEEVAVVLSALDSLSELLRTLQHLGLPLGEITDVIFESISDVLQGKVACQFNEQLGGGDEEPEESEYDEALFESACNMLPLFGSGMAPEKFTLFFGRICPTLLQRLKKANNNEQMKSQRSFIYGTLAECFSGLQQNSASYFDTLCPILINGLSDSFDQVRQNAVYGLGELVFYAGEKSFDTYPQILNALSQAVSKETESSALDNICGAIARLIINNCTLVPLEQVLPVLLQNLPLREDFDENRAIFQCFKNMYIQTRDVIYAFIEQILLIAIHVLYKEEFTETETRDNALALLKEVRKTFPDKFNNVANSNTEILAFLQTL